MHAARIRPAIPFPRDALSRVVSRLRPLVRGSGRRARRLSARDLPDHLWRDVGLETEQPPRRVKAPMWLDRGPF